MQTNLTAYGKTDADVTELCCLRQLSTFDASESKRSAVSDSWFLLESNVNVENVF